MIISRTPLRISFVGGGSDLPSFYKKHPGTNINAEIKINNILHRAFLKATNDININEEIFCHYGFTYWFQTEISTVGFLQEDEIEKNGFPEKIFEYPAFMCYINEFYPKHKYIDVKLYKNNYDVIIYFDDDSYVLMVINNYADQIQKIPIQL